MSVIIKAAKLRTLFFMALFSCREVNPPGRDELYLCELHPNWNTALEWRTYMNDYHQERRWRRGSSVSPPIGHYRRDHMTRWHDSHEHGSQITSSLPVHIAQANMDSATQQFLASITQESVLRFRVRLLKQLSASGTRIACKVL